jgi:hypothetical protein
MGYSVLAGASIPARIWMHFVILYVKGQLCNCVQQDVERN